MCSLKTGMYQRALEALTMSFEEAGLEGVELK